MSRAIEPRVEIVILHWGDAEDTAALLASLRGLDYGNFGILLVDQSGALDIDLSPNARLLRPGGTT